MEKKVWRRLGLTVLGALVAGLMAGGAARAASELIVYTAVEPEELTGFAKNFEAKHPGIKVKWVRDSTGIMTAKLLAEGKNTQADIVWGLAATSLLLLKDAGILEPYAPKGVEKLNPLFIDSDKPPSWVGHRLPRRPPHPMSDRRARDAGHRRPTLSRRAPARRRSRICRELERPAAARARSPPASAGPPKAPAASVFARDDGGEMF